MITNVRDLLYVPGRLVTGPSGTMDLTTPYPHGGTGLGLAKGIHVEVEPLLDPARVIRGSEFGNEIIDTVEGPAKCEVSGTLHSFDPDMLSRVFRNTSIGNVTQLTGVDEPGAVRAGSKGSTRAQVLVFSPDDVQRCPFFVVRNGIGYIQQGAIMQMMIDQEWGLPFKFVGIRDGNAKMWSFKPGWDLGVV